MPRSHTASVPAAIAVAASFGAACAAPAAVGGLDPLRPPPGVIVQEAVDSYPVTGTNRVEIARQLREGITDANGRGFAGLHRYSLRWRYDPRGDRSSCSVLRAFVNVTSTVTLPTWTASTGADSSLVAEWARFRTALAQHERGHREISYAAAGKVYRAIQNSREPTCTLLSTNVRRVADSLLAVGRRANEQYDADTRHGATQGATFRVRAP